MKAITLKGDNKPTEFGTYWAGNFNHMRNRLEIDSVTYGPDGVFVEDDLSPFIVADFDFWSDKVSLN